MGLFVAIFSGFALALAAPVVHRRARGAAGWLLALLPAGLFFYFASYLAAPQTVRVRIPWAPSLGVDLSLSLDGLSLLMSLLIVGVGALVLVYAGGYLAGDRRLGRLYSLLLVFLASMLGLVLADNMLVLFVFWELTSLSSFFLIGFDHQRAAARAAAWQALLVTSGGGLAMLAGLLLLGQAAGTLELSQLATRGDLLRADPRCAPGLLLVLLGAFTKSAQFPFHFWLPAAMEAPTPVSAYLHSATMVKAGVYLLARLSPTFGGNDLWFAVVTSVGLVTMLVGAGLATVQTDMKRILAYATVGALGLLTMLLGIGGETAVRAALGYLLAHALYKGGLFLVAGAVDHQAGTRDVRRLGGLARTMPMTALAAGGAALSMAGLPPLLGFVVKEFFYEATLHGPAAAWITSAALAANMLFVAAAGIVGLRPFLGKSSVSPETSRDIHPASPSLWFGPSILAAASVVSAVWPEPFASLLANAGHSTLGAPLQVDLALWHGTTPALGLSVVTLVGGMAVYAGRTPLRTLAAWAEPASAWGPAAGYFAALRGLNSLAIGLTRTLQHGYLRVYLLTIMTATVAATVAAATGGLTIGGRAMKALVHDGATSVELRAPALAWHDIRFFEAGLFLFLLLAAVQTAFARTRMAAVTALGATGYAVALVFVVFGAPDVAMAQFLIETLTVILFVLVFCRLPETAYPTSVAVRWCNGAASLAVGALMTAILLTPSAAGRSPVAAYYWANSGTLAHGRNVVNVVLVDFRALDTLGEITVLAAAAIGVYGLLKMRPRGDLGVRDELGDELAENRRDDGSDEQGAGR